jgi:hypothetical protein
MIHSNKYSTIILCSQDGCAQTPLVECFNKYTAGATEKIILMTRNDLNMRGQPEALDACEYQSVGRELTVHVYRLFNSSQ